MGRRVWVLMWVLIVVLARSAPAAPAPKPEAGHKSEKPEAAQKDEYELFKILVDAMDQVERNYVKPVDRRELVEAAIQGMLAKLDPYSSYINPEELERFRASVESEFGGIGVQISLDGGQLRVLSPLVDTPAYRAGLLAGDRITEIEGQSTDGITIDKAMQQLKGRPGTKVRLQIQHAGAAQPQPVTITRDTIHVDTVLGERRLPNDQWDFMLDHEQRIGYIRLAAFSRDTARDLHKALQRLREDKLRGLILDLRFNPGGLLNSAIEVSDLFLSQGRIVSTSGRNSPERVWDAQPDDDDFVGFPMVVLINRYSASASEIVAACLQDHHRALVVGERSWGKGSVQNVIELEDGDSLLKLTTSSYLRPNGHNIHRFPKAKDTDEWGVKPDKGYDLKLSDDELANEVEDRRLRDVVQPHERAAAIQVAKTDAKPGKTPRKDKTAKGDTGKPKSDAAQPQSKPDAKPTSKPESGPKSQPSTRPELKGPSDLKGPSSSGDDAKSAVHRPTGKFVDRQLEMAVEYLHSEFARVDKQ